jgi:hypothetical protein
LDLTIALIAITWKSAITATLTTRSSRSSSRASGATALLRACPSAEGSTTAKQLRDSVRIRKPLSCQSGEPCDATYLPTAKVIVRSVAMNRRNTRPSLKGPVKASACNMLIRLGDSDFFRARKSQIAAKTRTTMRTQSTVTEEELWLGPFGFNDFATVEEDRRPDGRGQDGPLTNAWELCRGGVFVTSMMAVVI